MALLDDSRRTFLKALGAGLASSYLVAKPDGNDNNGNEDNNGDQNDNSGQLPGNPKDSGIEHVVVLMMENRSFDHFLGWMRKADGKQAGLTYFDQNNQPHNTYHLTDYQGCAHPVPDNTYQGARTEYDNGACDGWLRAGQNDNYVIGYYSKDDLAFLGQATNHWVTCDRYFAATMSETFPNRMYQHAAQTDRQDNSLVLSTLPTIWDSITAAGLGGRYYFSDVPFLALWGAKYLPISQPVDAFFVDCAAGTLPNVSFVDPRFLGELEGISNDDHPHADIRNGEVFMNRVYAAVTSSPAWGSTVLIINFDEWGGFFDHVAPGTAADLNLANALRGFRVPCLVISPWSQKNHVSHTVFDHASVLKLIEWRWNLPTLTPRDASANNLALALDFSKPEKGSPAFDVPGGPFGQPCLTSAAVAQISEWSGLAGLAQTTGWKL